VTTNKMARVKPTRQGKKQQRVGLKRKEPFETSADNSDPKTTTQNKWEIQTLPSPHDMTKKVENH
jgi:hypothetical protein